MRRRARRQSATALLGDGTSFEEVLTVITVLLLLRVVFMVPMVNLDKAKTVAARTDTYWSEAAAYVLDAGDDETSIRPYRAAFGIRGAVNHVTRTGDHVIIESASPDSSLLVVRHEPGTKAFVAMLVQGGGVRSFRRGRLLWSQAEREWFVGADTVDYGSHPRSIEMEKSYRAWTNRERGY